MSPNSHRIIALITLLFTFIANAQAQNIEVLFSGIRSTRGQIVVKVFVDEKGFDDDKPVKILKFNKQGAVNGEKIEKFNLDPGVYGLALLDDENSNSEMEYNFIGMPKEGFGFSNFYLSGLKKPKFDQFKFTLNKEQKLRINMKIRYL
jgi:uncharacterized protein (DUF2141 family)